MKLIINHGDTSRPYMIMICNIPEISFSLIFFVAMEPIEERRVTWDIGMIVENFFMVENFEYLLRFNTEAPTGQ